MDLSPQFISITSSTSIYCYATWVECETDLDIRSLQIRPQRLRFTCVPLLHGEACNLYNFGLYFFPFLIWSLSFYISDVLHFDSITLVSHAASYCTNCHILFTFENCRLRLLWRFHSGICMTRVLVLSLLRSEKHHNHDQPIAPCTHQYCCFTHSTLLTVFPVWISAEVEHHGATKFHKVFRPTHHPVPFPSGWHRSSWLIMMVMGRRTMPE